MLREMITSLCRSEESGAIAKFAGRRLDNEKYALIVRVCNELLAGQHHECG